MIADALVLQQIRGVYMFRHNRIWSLGLVLLQLILSGCSIITGPIDDAINQIDKNTKAIQGESHAWRNELPKLINQLSSIESNAAANAKSILTDETNQIQELATQTLKLADAEVNGILGNTNALILCDTDFVKTGALAELQSIRDDLVFWKANKKHKDQKPDHAVCVINPSMLSPYPSGNNWLIDPSNLPNPNIMNVYGYNFRSDALPVLELHAPDGTKVRNIKLRANYVTRFQVNLDFSNENFPDVQKGETVVFNWPDKQEGNSINLTLIRPVELTISNPLLNNKPPEEFSPEELVDSVTLQVTIKNNGDKPSGGFDVVWIPDPNDPDPHNPTTITAHVVTLEPDQLSPVTLPKPYVYQRDGMVKGTVSINNGAALLPIPINVRSSTYSSGPSVETDCCGGSGGHGQAPLGCGSGSVAIGLEGAAHTNLDRVGLSCAILLPNGSWGDISNTPIEGGGGSDPFKQNCSPNQILIGLAVRSSNILEAIGGDCATAANIADKQLDTTTVTQTDLWGSHVNGSPFDARCTSGSAVAGLRLNLNDAGDRIVHMWMYCVPIIRDAPPPPPPPPPPPLSAPTLNPIIYEPPDNGEGFSFSASWSSVDGATAYEMQQRNPSGNWSTIYNRNETSWAWQPNQGVGTYWVRVRASNSGGSSDWSNIRSVKVSPPPTPHCPAKKPDCGNP